MLQEQIKNIVERLSLSSDDVLDKDRKSIVLEYTDNNKYGGKDRKLKDNCC
jgi:hypothetical protein